MNIIQIVSLDGKFVDELRWEIESITNLHVGDDMQISIPSNDRELLTWLASSPQNGCTVELEKEGNSLILNFKITRFRHMFDLKQGVSSMVILVPINRSVESIIFYTLVPKLCDQRFANLIHK